ncbi:lipid droplet-associated protein [Gordonia humi]|uniref:Lipid droplet-associated protein n=1 Tax=Gordonia humi TaxID=686429 RepID=A0A840F7P4_9ACTN|nr:lipid droplet-associated protein [Gordonia humi]MBB4135547.1 hypothetical protein [Gordonia humi]
MNRPPYAARVVAGLLVTTVEETRKLPTRVITMPMSAVSSAVQAGMRLQQNVAELAIKGDEILAPIFDKTEEQPAWATFDEDEIDPPAPAPAPKAPAQPASAVETPDDAAEPEPAAGRFALYSSPPADVTAGTTATAPVEPSGSSPAIVTEIGYDSLTLAQLRAKVRTLGLADLQTLAEYERANRNRSPFVTMIDNRVTGEQKKADAAQ